MIVPTPTPTPIPLGVPYDLELQIPVSTIPLSAWAQAVAICLFIVFAGLVMWYFFKNARESTKATRELVSTFINTLEKRDIRFFDELDKRDKAFDHRNGMLASKIDTIHDNAIVHHTEVRAAIIETSRAIREMRATVNRHKPSDLNEDDSDPRSTRTQE